MELAPGLNAYIWNDPSANNCNTYYLGTPAPALLDPGLSLFYGNLAANLEGDGLSAPAVVILSHSHPDHMQAAAGLQAAGARIAMHPAGAEFMRGQGAMLARMLGMELPELEPDILLEEGALELGGEELEVFHTPGHSPGHVCLLWPRHRALFAGDLIFAQGVGRSDFPGSDPAALEASVRRMAGLELEWLLPGHGPLLKGAANIKKNFSLLEEYYFRGM